MDQEAWYVLKTYKPSDYSSDHFKALQDLGNSFKKLGIALSDDLLNVSPFSYGFKASRRLTDKEIYAVLKSLKDRGYGEFKLEVSTNP